MNNIVANLYALIRRAPRAPSPSGGDASDRPGGSGQPLVTKEDIGLNLVFAKQQDLLEEIGQHMQSVHGLNGEDVTRARWHIGNASPRPGSGTESPCRTRVRGLGCIRSMYLRLMVPLPFGAADGLPVKHVFVLLVPKEAVQEHLDVLAQVTQAFANLRFRQALDAAQSPTQVRLAFEAMA